jgi:predicted small secreted protein
MMFRKIAVAVVAAAALLGACETTEGYRQQVSTWQGRTGDDLMIEWGAPDERSMLSDGREMWSFYKTSVTENAGYWRDESRNATRTFTDKEGKQKTETITETFPVWQPPTTYRSNCSTRFILSSARRIEQVSFDGNACVAAERKG